MAEHVGLSGAELLKKFALRITTPSTKERIGLLQDVTDRVGKSEIPENAVKGIFKYLTLVIGIYQDNGSRRAVLQLVKTIAKTYPDSALKNVTVALTSQAESQKKRVHASRSSSGEALFCLAWTCIIMKEIFLIGGEKNKEELKKLVVIQCGLVYGALAAGIQAISVSTFRKMVAIFSCSDSSDGQYANLLMEVEPSMFVLSPAGLLMKYLTEKKKQALIEQHKKPFLELYIKHILGSRVKPNTQLLLTCNNILRHCTREDFKDQVLPATQKAMLRSPEIILQSIGVLMGGVSIDLGTFAEELAKPLGAQLISKNEVTRAEACKAFQNLAKQCSDSGNIEKLVIHLVGVLNGSEGKLTVADQRISVLQALGNVSVNTVSGANTLQNLSTTVAEKFIPFLQAEAHEGTLIHALNMLSLWCVKFYTCVPDKLMQWFKKGLTLKTSTSPVRNAYIQCMNASFHGDTLPQAIDMISILIQTMEKANSQSSQSQLVSEAVSAACILAKLSLVDIQAETKLGPFWGIVLDSKKQLLLNEKFLSSVAEDVLCSIVSLSEKLILEYPQKMTEKVSRPYYHAIVFCLTHKSWSVRKHTANTVKRILSLLGGATISLSLVEEFSSLLLTQKVIDPEVLSGDNDKENVTDISKFIKPVILCRALLALTNVEKADPKDSEAIAMATLLPAHHECIVQANSSVWTDILYQLNLDARKFIQKNAKACINHATTDQSLSQSCQCMVSTLARIGPEFVFPDLMMYTTQLLDNPELMTITKDEFGMFKCKDGELYDQTLLSQFEKSSDGQESNVRRENKLYSFKEQMAEIELRKELEKKKGKPAKEPVKLSKKQEEMLQAQREKEADVRKRLSKLNDEVTCACQILQALQEGNLDVLSSYMKTVCNSIVPLFKSPLAADMSTKVFLSLSKALYDDELLGSVVSNVTVRLLEPQCVVNQEWTIEAPQKQGRRVIQMLFEQTVKNSDDDSEIFPSAVFVLAFYLLRVGLEKGGEAIGKDEITMVNAIKIIMAHAGMRQSKDGEKHNPKQLPHYEMIQLLLHVIGTASSKIQQLAGVTLVEVCLCISGEEECATASDRDIRALLQALMSSCTACRDSSLQGLQCLISVLPSVTDNYELGLEIAQRVWVASYDGDENVKRLAESLRVKLQLEEPYDELWSPLIEDVIHPEEIVRQSAAKALEKTLSCNPDSVPAALQELISKYEEKLYIPPPVLDSFGRPVGDEAPDQWPARSGIALALQSVSPLLTTEQISELFQFYVPKALGDRAVEVRTRMRDAATSAVNTHGQDNVNTLLPVFEEFLSSAPDTASFDAVRQSIVILMGSLAKHLDKDNPKIKPIVAQLIGALSTPSQEVQEAVANCLPPLVPGIKQNAPELVQKLMQLLLESENYGERRGAAYGLAGLVRGLGITALKQLEIMSTLEQAVKDKKNPRRREGALFAYEMLCTMLGKLFEPYVVHILPHLLLCFGDNSQYVRQAADDTSKGVMSMLTAHGVKLVLPSLLKGLEEDAWRTKAGAVELLGAMAFCAPKQLSACLPSIVPKLGEVLADSHVKVQMAGAQALKQIGSVIRNPEIQAIVPVLLEALQEPTKKTNLCLQSLLETKFVHFIDAPSLALIMPVVERAFQDRNTETRKMAAQIIGNMYSLTDQKDLDPYIEKVIPGLKQSLLDPVPEVRTVSAKALGAMVKGMGGAKFDELLKWLMETLKSEQSSVDRSGAAQGLSEVIGGLGVSELQRLMPGIIQTAERPDIPSHVRDGYIMLYIYLPGVFEKNFLDYIGLIIPSILQALADESEFVRDTALRAGQRIINMYADTAIELLLPELENGLFDDNWRIRYSSVQLLGDLLYKISGVSGKMTTETAHEDDNFGTESSQKVIMHALGKERRNRVLAGLYMGRSDTALLVRQSALHVWKIIVAHTPQTLREILGTLFSLLLGCLASTSHDKRQVAARTLGDLVKKLGERVLPEIIPILEKGLDSKEADQRQGVCIGLSEIMSATSKDHVTVFADSLIPTVRRALIDPLPEVRVAAAQTFDNLHANISQRALDEILPDLLSKLEDPVLSEAALDGLKQVMMVKSRVVLPYLIPQLITPPVNTRALSFLSSVAGDSLSRHLGKVLPALMSSLSQAMNTPNESEELENCRKVVLSVEDDIGVRTIMQELMSATNTSSTPQCWAAVNMLHTFCDQTEADYSDYLPQLFRGLIGLFVKKEERVLQASWDCLNSVTKKLDVTDMLQHIADVRQAVRFALSDFKGKELPGFSLPKKGIAPVLPIFREGILNGSQDMKAQAADGLGELINVTSAEALKPSVVNITGPLIRILGDRFTWQVKVAVLETLTLLLAKVGAQLKPFLPQLQTTFLKALNDPQRSVRLKAASALGRLIVIHIRVDPLFTELHTGIKNATDTSVKDTMLQALRFCVVGAGKKMAEGTRKGIMGTLLSIMGCQEDSTRSVASGCVGAMCGILPSEELADVMIQHLLESDSSLDWTLRHARGIALGVALKESPEELDKYGSDVKKVITTLATADRIPLSLCGYRAAAYVVRKQVERSEDDPNIMALIVKGMKHESNDVKQLVTQIVTFVSQDGTPLPITTVKTLIPALVMGTKEKNSMVRSNSEYALISILQLRKDDSLLTKILAMLDTGMKDSLNEVVHKSLNKLCKQPPPLDEDIDDTVLK